MLTGLGGNSILASHVQGEEGIHPSVSDETDALISSSTSPSTTRLELVSAVFTQSKQDMLWSIHCGRLAIGPKG